eukprot:scaffold107541_cov66-Cyclotella_meneghiniana.AAC.1
MKICGRPESDTGEAETSIVGGGGEAEMKLCFENLAMPPTWASKGCQRRGDYFERHLFNSNMIWVLDRARKL